MSKFTVNTSMREAFMNTKVKRESDLTQIIVNVLSTKAGIITMK